MQPADNQGLHFLKILMSMLTVLIGFNSTTFHGEK